MANISVKAAGIHFNSPIILASGTAAYGKEIFSFYSPQEIGGISLKAVSVNKRRGNKPPRVYEARSAVMNAIGLANEGLDSFLESTIKELRGFDCVKIANVVGESVEEYVKICRALAGRDEIDMLELNVSCPNVKAGGRVFGESIDTLKELVSACKGESAKPLIVKLPPMLFGIEEYAQVCEGAGADMISLTNTIPAMDIDSSKKVPVLGNNFGGLSGPAILPIALRLVYLASKAVKIPVIGGGGIDDAEDAFKFLLAGATLVSVGTANMYNPKAGAEISEGLRRLLSERGYSDLDSIKGELRLYER